MKIVRGELTQFAHARANQRGRASIKIIPPSQSDNQKFIQKLESDFDKFMTIAMSDEGCAWRTSDEIPGTTDVQANNRPYKLSKLSKQIASRFQIARQNNYNPARATVMYGHMRIYNEFVIAVTEKLKQKYPDKINFDNVVSNEVYGILKKSKITDPCNLCIPNKESPKWEQPVGPNSRYQTDQDLQDDII
jgi:hypothetical protein